MKKNKTEIVLIVDNSGSMQSIKEDSEGGLKTFLDGQRTVIGECGVTHYRFSTTTEKIFENVPIQDVEDIKIRPTSWTALLDAVGIAIKEVGLRLENTIEEQRPELVIFLIITDGQENSSKEFTSEQINEMIKHQEEKYNWQFVYIGANHDAWQTGGQYGISLGKSMTYNTSYSGMAATYSAVNDICSTMRTLNDKKMAALVEFTDEDRTSAVL